MSSTSTYLHVEFTSALWQFVDNAEFSFDESKAHPYAIFVPLGTF